MKNQIKKINNLNELDSLAPGESVRIKNYVEDGCAVFEGKFGDEYRFMELNSPLIWSNIINKKYIEFENGMIKTDLRNISGEAYDEKKDFYQSKLKLIKGAKK